MPLGPQISGKCYYANCRLAFTTFSAFMWGKHAPPGGCWITLVTRVMEKPAILTQLLFDKVPAHHSGMVARDSQKGRGGEDSPCKFVASIDQCLPLL